VALIAGPPGPTSVHTPEICYSSRNHDVIEQPVRIPIARANRPGDMCWRITLQARDVDESRLRVHYAWATLSGVWEAARFPRFAYCGEPLLYKFQLASTLPADEVAQTEPDREFLEAFL